MIIVPIIYGSKLPINLMLSKTTKYQWNNHPEKAAEKTKKHVGEDPLASPKS